MRRLSLHHPQESSFAKFFNSGQDDTLVTMCGFDHTSFAILHAKFKVEYNKYTPYSKNGQILKLPPQQDVRIGNKKHGQPTLIAFFHSLFGVSIDLDQNPRFVDTVLQVIVGLTLGQLSLWLRFSFQLVVKVLRDDPHAKAMIPSDMEIRGFEAAIVAKYPALTMDGLKLWIQRAGDQRVQNMFF
jgi:hypothetical protein